MEQVLRVLYQRFQEFTPILVAIQNTHHLLIDEADYFHPITKDDWFSLTPPKRNSKSTRKKSTRKKKA